MKDYIVSATAGGGFVRAYAAATCGAVEKARQIHNTSPVVTAALGRLMTGTVIMGSMLKGDEIVTCRIKCDGEIGGLIAVADANGNVKGYPNNGCVDIPLSAAGKLDVARAVGKGVLNVSKDLGLKEPYVGEINLVSSEIAEDFAYYYVKSEQTPSAVALGVLVDRTCKVLQAGGFIIQLLPGASGELADILTERLAGLPPITEMLMENSSAEHILNSIFYDMNLTINSATDVSFKCKCNYEKLYKVVVALGKNELSDILSKEKHIELKCHFCNEKYYFDEETIKQIVKGVV